MKHVVVECIQGVREVVDLSEGDVVGSPFLDAQIGC